MQHGWINVREWTGYKTRPFSRDILVWVYIIITRYKEAAKLNDAEALNNLGRLYEDGKGVTKDENMALDFYLKAAEKKHLDAQTNLAIILEKKAQTRDDLTKAVSWFKASSDAGYARAQNRLGSMYYTGKGVLQDYTAAVDLFRSAAEQVMNIVIYRATRMRKTILEFATRKERVWLEIMFWPNNGTMRLKNRDTLKLQTTSEFSSL